MWGKTGIHSLLWKSLMPSAPKGASSGRRVGHPPGCNPCEGGVQALQGVEGTGSPYPHRWGTKGRGPICKRWAGPCGGTSEQFRTLSPFPHPKPSKKPFKGRKSVAEGQGPARHLQSHHWPLRDQNPAICERKAPLYFRLVLSLGGDFSLVFSKKKYRTLSLI